MNYDLVTVKRNEIFTDSKVIAQGTNNRHDSIHRLIRKYEKNIAKFGE